AEGFAERSGLAHGSLGQPALDKAYDRHCRLLRARRERPCCCAVSWGSPQGQDVRSSIAGQDRASQQNGPLMSALGLGRVKTFVLATRVENLGATRIVFSTFRGCMSFHTARVKSKRRALFGLCPLYPRKRTTTANDRLLHFMAQLPLRRVWNDCRRLSL